LFLLKKKNIEKRLKEVNVLFSNRLKHHFQGGIFDFRGYKNQQMF